MIFHATALLGYLESSRKAEVKMRHSLSASLMVGFSILGSFAFACAAPFAAIGAFAATEMGRPLGLTVVALAWLSNQIIGFAILGYPTTADAFAWGAAIGAAILLGFAASRMAIALASRRSSGPMPAFLASLAAYELTLYGASALLSTSGDAFSFATLARVFAINLAAFAGIGVFTAASPSLNSELP
jgi:hypothetical protein